MCHLAPVEYVDELRRSAVWNAPRGSTIVLLLTSDSNLRRVSPLTILVVLVTANVITPCEYSLSAPIATVDLSPRSPPLMSNLSQSLFRLISVPTSSSSCLTASLNLSHLQQPTTTSPTISNPSPKFSPRTTPIFSPLPPLQPSRPTTL
jgi:hypothetical protein